MEDVPFLTNLGSPIRKATKTQSNMRLNAISKTSMSSIRASSISSKRKSARLTK